MRFSRLTSYKSPGNSVLALCIITAKPIQIGTLRWKKDEQRYRIDSLR